MKYTLVGTIEFASPLGTSEGLSEDVVRHDVERIAQEFAARVVAEAARFHPHIRRVNFEGRNVRVAFNQGEQ